MCPNITPRNDATAAKSSPGNEKETMTMASTADKSLTCNLQQCSASDFGQQLLQERFAGNSSKSIAFLKQVIQSIESGPTKGDSTATNANAHVKLGNTLLSTPLETSLLNPRGGKCSIQLYDNGYFVATQLKDSSVQLILPASFVSHLVLFAKPEDYKIFRQPNSSKKQRPPSAHMVCLTLRSDSSDVHFQNKPVTQVCFALSWTKGVGPTPPDLTEEMQGSSTSSSLPSYQRATLAWRKVLEQCLNPQDGKNKVMVAHVPATHTKEAPFCSARTPDQSTTTGGMPFVKCYHGVQDGVLYPLKEGLLFYKPAKFLPRSQLVSIACGRGSGGGQSSSRYVDMVIEKEGTTVEFTNIQREELGDLNAYIRQVLIPAMKQDANEYTGDENNRNSQMQGNDHSSSTEDDAAPSATGEMEEEEEDTDDEDENFVDGDDDNGGDDDDGNDNDGESDSDDDDYDYGSDEDDDFEVVNDDFAMELAAAKKKGATTDLQDEPRASRSSKRKGSTAARDKSDHEDESSVMGGDDDDFEVVQAVESSTESEGDDRLEASPTKKSRTN